MNKYINLPFTMSINGFCGSGKSHMIRYLISCFKNEFDCVIIISNTANFTQDYEFLKELGIKHFIFNSLVFDEKVKMTMSIQKKNRLNNVLRKVLIIFDDILGSVKDNNVFKDLISTYRHYNISVIFSVQYISASASYLREISNYIIIFNQRTNNALKLCYENYFADSYENYNLFKLAFCKSLENYAFYFIDRIKNTKNIMRCPNF